jgi:hypothetical protein
MLLAVSLGLAALAGCTAAGPPGGQPSAGPSQPPPPASPAPSPQGVNIAAFHALAGQEARDWPQSPLAKVWKTSLVIPSTDDLTYLDAVRGFPSDEVREAFGNGNLVFTGPPPSGTPVAVVKWPAAVVSMKVPVLSEAQTFSALKNNTWGRCPGCATKPLDVTYAQPYNLAIKTSRGDALVPAWAFTVQGVDGLVLQAALTPGSYITENSVRVPAENLSPLGHGFVGANEASVLSPDGRTLSLYLANNSCSQPATSGGLVAEVGDVVVVGGWVHDPQPVANCVPSDLGQYVTVRLAAPLGNRMILDAATGLPAPSPFHPAPERDAGLTALGPNRVGASAATADQLS